MEKYNMWHKKLSDQFFISIILVLISFIVWLISVKWH
jgi:hypothetical protein